MFFKFFKSDVPNLNLDIVLGYVKCHRIYFHDFLCWDTQYACRNVFLYTQSEPSWVGGQCCSNHIKLMLVCTALTGDIELLIIVYCLWYLWYEIIVCNQICLFIIFFSRRDHLMSETMDSYRPRSLGSLHHIEDSVSMLSLSERFNTAR